MSDTAALSLYMRLLLDAEGVEGKLELFRAVARAALTRLSHGRGALHVRRPVVLHAAGVRWSVPVFDNSFASTSPGHDVHSVLPEMRRLLAQSARRVCLDIGANLGFVSIPLAREFPDHRVVAIEPIPWLAAAISDTARMNALGNMTVVPRAIAPGASLRLAVPTVDRVRLTTLSSGGAQRSHEADGRTLEHVEVPAVSLDALLEELRITPAQVACVKIDVEGFEAEALATGRRALSARPPVLFEALGSDLQLHTEDVLRSFGYARFRALDHFNIVATA